MSNRSLLEQLIDALRCLPGVGPKSAQRMALHLLERDRDAARQLGETMITAMERIGRCQQCRDLTEHELCAICSNPGRNTELLCVVESPVDVLAIRG
jgi:recombination protein RecR